MTSTALPRPNSLEPLRPSLPAPQTNVLGPVLEMGREDARVGLLIGGAVAGLVHGYIVLRVLMALIAMGAWVGIAREEAHAYFWATYEVEAPKDQPKPAPKEEEPPPPPPDPPPQQDPPPAALPKPDEIYKEQPANKPAMAPDLVTAKADSQAPEQFYEVVDHDGSKGPITGNVSNQGEGNQIVKDPNARNDGQKGGSGTGPAGPPPPPPKVDRSRPPTLVGSTAWSCPFPAEADAEGKDSALAVIVVTVRPDGTPQGVSVVSDPGSGFGRAARRCALGRRYSAGLDKDGQATTANTPPIRVKFSR